MENYRLKIKIGEHEFEAEGPVEVVQSQFAAFKDLISSVPVSKKPLSENTEPIESVNNSGQLALEKITKADGRVVSLTARATSVSDAVMVILLAQRIIRKNELATGSEITDGLRDSGQVVRRIDSTMDKLASEGDVIKTGSGRGTRYRLTDTGLVKAQETAKRIIDMVP